MACEFRHSAVLKYVRIIFWHLWIPLVTQQCLLFGKAENQIIDKLAKERAGIEGNGETHVARSFAVGLGALRNQRVVECCARIFICGDGIKNLHVFIVLRNGVML